MQHRRNQVIATTIEAGSPLVVVARADSDSASAHALKDRGALLLVASWGMGFGVAILGLFSLLS